jgi:hypothetical protein
MKINNIELQDLKFNHTHGLYGLQHIKDGSWLFVKDDDIVELEDNKLIPCGYGCDLETADLSYSYLTMLQLINYHCGYITQEELNSFE